MDYSFKMLRGGEPGRYELAEWVPGPGRRGSGRGAVDGVGAGRSRSGERNSQGKLGSIGAGRDSGRVAGGRRGDAWTRKRRKYVGKPESGPKPEPGKRTTEHGAWTASRSRRKIERGNRRKTAREVRTESVVIHSQPTPRLAHAVSYHRFRDRRFGIRVPLSGEYGLVCNPGLLQSGKTG